MSKTRSKQGIEEKWGDRSNVSSTIVNQGIEGSFVYCANGPMTIGKSHFEGGMTIYAQKLDTAVSNFCAYMVIPPSKCDFPIVIGPLAQYTKLPSIP